MSFAVRLFLGLKSYATSVQKCDDVIRLVAQSKLTKMLVKLIELDGSKLQDELLYFFIRSHHVVEGNVQRDDASWIL